MKHLRLLALLIVIALPGNAAAACPDCTSCQVEVISDLDFGTFSIIDEGDQEGVLPIDISCSQNSNAQGGSVAVIFSINDYRWEDNGFPMFTPDRANSLNYDVYHDPGHRIPFYHSDEQYNPRIIPIPSGERSFLADATVYGLVLPGQNPPAGQYFDYTYVMIWY